jgi:hypothetical protein
MPRWPARLRLLFLSQLRARAAVYLSCCIRRYSLSLFLVGVFDCKMLRCLVRLRPPSLLTASTPLGIRCVVASAWVAGYGCVWHGSAYCLRANCVHTPLCTGGAAYGCIRSLYFSLMF